MARSTQELVAASRAFMESRILLTALELDIFTLVGEGASGNDVARRAGCDPRAAAMLLDALASLGMLDKSGGAYRCTPGSLPLGPGRAGLMHTVHLWDTWTTLTECVRQGTSVARRRGAERGQDHTEAFIEAMRTHAQALAPGVAAKVLAHLGRPTPSRMLDVGGGPGTYALAFALACPGLKAEVLDLEGVVPIAQRHIREAGMAGRVAARAGDLRRDDLGRGYDLVLVSAICHMLDEAGNLDLFRRCAAALAPGGSLAVRDFILDPDRAGPPQAAVFALNMLVGTEKGNSYTEAEYRAWMEEAGLEGVARLEGGDVMVARRPLTP